jgi:hypothetical protein
MGGNDSNRIEQTGEIIAMTSFDTLKTASELLRDIGASFEYPGFIEVSKAGKTWAIGDANQCFGYEVTD